MYPLPLLAASRRGPQQARRSRDHPGRAAAQYRDDRPDRRPLVPVLPNGPEGILLAEGEKRDDPSHGELEIVGTQPARDLKARRAVEWLDALAETRQRTDLVGRSTNVQIG